MHASDVESAPLYVHKLPQNTNTLLLTDRLIYTTNNELDSVSIISTLLSESPLEGDSVSIVELVYFKKYKIRNFL